MISKDDAPKPVQQAVPASTERRRLLRGTIAAAPVLMTVTSRPVLGQVCTASAATSISATTSLAHNCQLIPTGLSPDQWKALADRWPTPYTGASTSTTSTTSTTSGTSTTARRGSTSTLSPELYAQYYGTTPTTSATTLASGTASQPSGTAYHCPTTGLGGRVFGTMSMLQVIDVRSGGSLDALGRYIVAALLNARSGRTPMLAETGVRNMWNDLINRGYYEPTAGVHWGAAEIVAYIKTTIA